MPASLPGHAELTLDEARAAAALRREHLHTQVEAQSSKMAGILAHLRLVEQALSDLEELQGTLGPEQAEGQGGRAAGQARKQQQQHRHGSRGGGGGG